MRIADLKKSVRKAKDGYQVTAARLEGRAAAFRIEFLLQQFEGHLGCPRRMLDPAVLLDFVGDARLGRGRLATLAQWYRMRPRAFAEVLEDRGERLRRHRITGPDHIRELPPRADQLDRHGEGAGRGSRIDAHPVREPQQQRVGRSIRRQRPDQGVEAGRVFRPDDEARPQQPRLLHRRAPAEEGQELPHLGAIRPGHAAAQAAAAEIGEPVQLKRREGDVGLYRCRV